MNTKKTRQMSNEPLEGKRITFLPGVGPALARNLIAKGYENAEDIYKIFLKYKERKTKFHKWMKVYGNARSSQSSMCYDSLKRWDEQFGEQESNTNNIEYNNVPGNIQKGYTRQSLKGCVKKSSKAAKKKAVKFQKATSDAKAMASESSENTDTDSTLVLPQRLSKKHGNVTNSDPLTSFFLSTLETVKTFPRSLQLQVKRQFFEIMINVEKKLASDEPEPVASTSYCSPGCSLQPQSSAPVLNKFQQNNTASMPVQNNFRENNVSLSTPIVLNNSQQDCTASSRPTLLNYYSVKQEKMDSPVASTSELQPETFTPNNVSLGETNEIIVLTD